MDPVLECSYKGTYSEKLIDTMCRTHGILPLTARALIRLGITEDREIEDFLHPEQTEPMDPLLLPDMEEAVERIYRAADEGERICVYGDYDADGVCATAIMVRCLRALGADVFYYIPSRHTEGYGLNMAALERIRKQGARLLLTVDNGITAIEEVRYAKELGMDVILTDHHQPLGTLPLAGAVVAATRKDCSPDCFPTLCGAGVAMKLASALRGGVEEEEDVLLAAVATVADVVPLLGENRRIVREGLGLLRSGDCSPGLSSLLKASGFKGSINEETLSFTIVPRLNAVGRLGDAAEAVELLLSDDETICDEQAGSVELQNRKRKELEQHILTDVRKLPEGQLLQKRAIVLRGEDWHLGVIGIAAGKLADQYHCPTLLFGERDDPEDPTRRLLVGSCRSVEGVHLFECISEFSSCFVKYGGHAGAAGITMRPDRFDEFAEQFDKYLCDRYPPEVFTPKVSFDDTVSIEEATTEAFRDLNRLAPFGEGNPLPVMCISPVMLEECRKMGKEDVHFSGMIRQREKTMRVYAFFRGDWADKKQNGLSYAAVGRLNLNRFQGTESMELALSELIPCRMEKFFSSILESLLYNNKNSDMGERQTYIEGFGLDPMSEVSVQREDMVASYRTLKEKLSGGIAIPAVLRSENCQLLWALCVFTELGFFEVDKTGKKIMPAVNPPKRRLEESTLFSQALLNH